MKNLVYRTITGTIYLGFFIGALWFSPYTFALLFSILGLVALHEFYRIVRLLGYQPMIIPGITLGLIVFITVFSFFQWQFPFNLVTIAILLVVPLFVATLYQKKQNNIAALAFTLMGLVYVSLPLALANYLVFFGGTGYDYRLLLGYFILLWSSDTFAYIFGTWVGRRRLFERLSPKKSWEGFIGGIACTLGAGVLLSFLIPVLSLADWLAIGAIVSVVGVFGDLFESMLKRAANVKDSGRIMPGHGGVLDRIDSVLLSLPVVYLYLILFK